MEPRFIILDEYGDSIRAFDDEDSARAFIKLRPEFTIQEIKPLTNEEFTALHGEPPF